MSGAEKDGHNKALSVLVRLQRTLIRRLVKYVVENESSLRLAADGAEGYGYTVHQLDELFLSRLNLVERTIAELSAMQRGLAEAVDPQLAGRVALYHEAEALITQGRLDDAEAILGDLERAEHYQRVVRSAARFVLQLIVKPEEAYFHTRPAQSLWGVRSFLTDTRLRIDHVQHALLALMKTRQALFGTPGPFRPVVSRSPPVNRRSPPPAPPLIPQTHRRARARD